MDPFYDGYLSYINEIIGSQDISQFKNNNRYREILEHCSPEHARSFYNLCKNEFNISDDDILKFAEINESVGNPIKYTFEFGTIAPTSVLYVYHAHIILTYLKSLNKNEVNIVEVGGGYGGLAIAMLQFANKFSIEIKEYHICDLDPVIILQEIYLKQVLGNIEIFKFHQAETYGANIENNNLFLISVYAFSEINKYYQERYLDILFPKIENGFILWNTPYNNFGREAKLEDERPQTGSINKFVYF
jgi:putative sugar O-methyltransferase